MNRSTENRTLKVLFVEDSGDDAFLLARELGRGGYEPEYVRVDTAGAAAEALRNGEWDIIICDYNMPRFGAHELLRMVGETGCDAPVIVVSGAVGEEQAVETMRAGAHDYIMKDNLTRLVPAVARELQEAQVRSERAAAEQALRESEARFRQLTGAIEEVFWLIDSETASMLYVSPAYEKVWQSDPRPLFKRLNAFLDTVHPEDFDRVQAALECDGWARFNEEYRIQRPDGATRWIETRTFPVRESGGVVRRIAAISTDVTSRKAMIAERRKLARALEQTADAVMIMDAKGRIEYVNGAFEDITGYGKEEVLARQPRFLRSGLQDETFYTHVWRTLKSGMPFTDVFVSKRKDGELYYEEKTITPIRDEENEISHYVATGRDITQRLRIEQRLEQLSQRDLRSGYAGRIIFLDRLRHAMLHARRIDLMTGILCIGLDLGSLLGEDANRDVARELVPVIARRLKEFSGEDDLVARLDSNEFGVLRREVSDPDELVELANAVTKAFAEPLQAGGYELFLTPKVGISLFPQDGDGPDELLANARTAMDHIGDDTRRPAYRFFSAAMRSRVHVNG